MKLPRFNFVVTPPNQMTEAQELERAKARIEELEARLRAIRSMASNSLVEDAPPGRRFMRFIIALTWNSGSTPKPPKPIHPSDT